MSEPGYQRSTHLSRGEEVRRAELNEYLIRHLPQDGILELFEGFELHRASSPTDFHRELFSPSLCVVTQGIKEFRVGDSLFQYDSRHYLITTVALPISGRYVEASLDTPCLSIIYKLDPTTVGTVLAEIDNPKPQPRARLRALNVSPLNTDLLDVILRFVKLSDKPSDAPYLVSLLRRELVYRLLQGGQGGRLGHLSLMDEPKQRITKAIERLRSDYTQQVNMKEVADDLGMSTSSFYHHFKAVTALSPLQFQKQVRLHEARRLMLSENLDAASAGYRVGYDDASHFNRDYKRLFGHPPLRDIQRFREATETEKA